MSTSIRLQRVDLTTSPKVVISKEIYKKIELLCSSIKKDEWSGILFYTIKGSVRTASKMIITVKDILLMDKGNKTYTEFEWDGDTVVSYRMDNAEAGALDWSVGHVHSHNTMPVFFSPTDVEELNDNCPNHNIYLSLIVNNFMEMTAKIAFTAEPLGFACKDEKGKDYRMELEPPKNNTVSTRTCMFVYSCKVVKPAVPRVANDAFTDRIQEVIKQAEEKEKNLAKIRQESAAAAKNQTPVKKLNNSTTYSPTTTYTPSFSIPMVESFICYLMRLGQVFHNDTVKEILEDVAISQIDEDAYVKDLEMNLLRLYDSYFAAEPNYLKLSKTLDVFVFIHNILKRMEKDFPLAGKIAVMIKETGMRMEHSSVAQYVF